MFVGGMPQAVERYVESKDLLAVKEVHKNILTLYRHDIGKDAEGYDLKVRGIFDALPGSDTKNASDWRASVRVLGCAITKKRFCGCRIPKLSISVSMRRSRPWDCS